MKTEKKKTISVNPDTFAALFVMKSQKAVDTKEAVSYDDIIGELIAEKKKKGSK